MSRGALSIAPALGGELPAIGKWTGEVHAVTPMSGGVLEIIVSLDSRLPWLPGQYVQVAFNGLPERAFCPTIGLDTFADETKLVFHVAVAGGGKVTPLLERAIKTGSPATIRGPFGDKILRRCCGRLVLASDGAGFAPVWSLALAARLSQPAREIVIVAGAHTIAGLYMRPALHWLQQNGVRHIAAVAGGGDGCGIKAGTADCHLPALAADDCIFAAGSYALVTAVAAQASAADAACHTMCFSVA